MDVKTALVLLSVSVFYAEVNCQCTTIGSNNETEFTAAAVGTPSIYLNTAQPASCNGTVERWRLCFYKPATHEMGDRYRLTLAVYHRTSSQYEIVGSSLRTITVDFPMQSNNFACQYIDLNTADQFNIETGDIVGACVFEPTRSSRERMDIVSEANGHSLMQINDNSIRCGWLSIPRTISHSQLLTLGSRLLHLSAIIAEPIIPITPSPTTKMSTTEQTISVVSTASDTTITDMTAIVSSGEISTTTLMTSSRTVYPTILTISESPSASTGGDSTIQTDATSGSTTISSSIASDSTINMTIPATLGQPMVTTSESTASTVDIATTTTQTDQPTTKTVSVAQTMQIVTTTLSTDDDDVTLAVAETGDATMIEYTKDDATTVAQIRAENSGTLNLTIIVGVIIAAVLLIISGIVVLIVMAVVFKKRGKSVGVYSLPNNSDSTLNIPNGVDNLTYGAGFHNPGALNTSINLYDDLTKSVNTGEGNYFELAESGLSNTYESVTAGVYSELSAAHSITSTQLQQANDQNPHGDINCYELEYDYSSPEDFNASFSLLLEKNKQEDIYGSLAAYYAPASNEDEIYSQLKSCGTKNIHHDQIRIMGHLGSGQFGNVEKGVWQTKEVALKTLKTDSIMEDKVKFLQEAAIMAQFKHPNIVTLHGVVSDKQPLILVVELMHRGDLRDYLHSLRPDPGELPLADLPQTLLSFSQHVALGMQYLSGKGFVHRDLAARNILVSKDNVCKVADFGMSRDLADETYYVSRGGKIPVKWTAPEAIHYRKYSTASDVWSYGCLLYEIWSLGCKPFEGMANDEVVKILDSNTRLSPPPGCPRMIYELMIKCWDPVVGDRPRFRELTIVLIGNPQDVLSIPQKALDAHKCAGVLGSPLEAGKNMYSDLRNKYCSKK